MHPAAGGSETNGAPHTTPSHNQHPLSQPTNNDIRAPKRAPASRQRISSGVRTILSHPGTISGTELASWKLHSGPARHAHTMHTSHTPADNRAEGWGNCSQRGALHVLRAASRYLIRASTEAVSDLSGPWRAGLKQESLVAGAKTSRPGVQRERREIG